MESILYGIAIGSFFCAGISAIVAIIIFRRLDVLDAWNFLRNKKVVVTSAHASTKHKSGVKKTSKHERVKKKQKPQNVVESTQDVVDADSPTDIIRGSKKVAGTSTLFVEETEAPTSLLNDNTEVSTTVLSEDSEAQTTLLKATDETESPTTVLEAEETEAPTSVLGARKNAGEDENAFMFNIVQSEVVIHTDEKI